MKRAARWMLIATLASVVGVRALLPFAIARYGESVIDRNGIYASRIGDVDLQLFRASIQIENLEIYRRNGQISVPLFAAPRIEVSIEPRFRERTWFGAIEVLEPEINLVAGPTPEQSQTGLDANWEAALAPMKPLHLDRLALRGGEFHFRNFHAEPAVDVRVRDLDLVILNLGNSEARSGDRVGRLALLAEPMESGRLRARASFDPFAARPSFDFDGELTDLELDQLNPLLRAYVHVDVEAGSLSLYSELAAEDGRFHGYLKPIVANARILTKAEQEEQGALADIWEGLVAATTAFFENQQEEQVAARVPVEGSVDDPDASVWAAIGSVWWNAFVEALPARLEHSVGDR